MVKIRLKRMGAKKRPFYRLVVADSRSPRDGKFIEEIGFYDPLPNPARVQIDADKVREWMRRGARPSDVARKLLEREGILQRSAASRRPAPPAAAAEGVMATAGAAQATEGAASIEEHPTEEAGATDEAGEE